MFHSKFKRFKISGLFCLIKKLEKIDNLECDLVGLRFILKKIDRVLTLMLKKIFKAITPPIILTTIRKLQFFEDPNKLFDGDDNLFKD